MSDLLPTELQDDKAVLCQPLCMCAKSFQLCLTLCDPMDHSPPGSSVHGILMATHSSILAWRIPWTEETGRLQSIGSQRVGHNWNDLACMHRGWYSTTLSSYSSVSKRSDTGHPGLESRFQQGYTEHSHFTTSTSSCPLFPHIWGPSYHIGLTWIIWDSSNLKVVWLSSIQFSLVAQSYPTLCDPMDCSMPGLLAHHRLPEFIPTHVHWVRDATQPSHPLLSPSPPAFNLSQNQGLLNESALHIRWPKYWSFSFSISPSNEYSGLISFRMNWLDLLAVQGTLKSLLQHHS